jgi:hypothetical protein
MSSNFIPVVLKDTAGNIKTADSAELDYIAYQAGVYSTLATGLNSGDLSNTNLDSGTYVGAFVDTFYNEAVGTHPASSLSTGSITTKLYQVIDATPVDLDAASAFRRPVADSNGPIDLSISSMDALGETIMSRIQGREFPGSFRLSTTSPSGDSSWSEYISDVFSDTNTNGTVNSYSIWQRTSGSLPDSCSPMYVRRESYGNEIPAAYDGGLQAMTQEQTRATFGRILQHFFQPGEVGAYQLRSATDGAPTDTGTWVARGSAVDTKYQITDVQYSGQYTGYSEQQYQGDRTYLGDYTSLPTVFAGTREYAGFRTYTGAYGAPPVQFTGERQFAGFRTYSGQYTSAPTEFAGFRQFSGSRTYATQYTSLPEQFAGVRYFAGDRTYSTQYTSTPEAFAGFRQFAGVRPAPQQFANPENFVGPRSYEGSRNYGAQYSAGGFYSGPRQFGGARNTSRPGIIYQSFAGSRPTTYTGVTYYYRPAPVSGSFMGVRGFAGWGSINWQGTFYFYYNGANYRPYPTSSGGSVSRPNSSNYCSNGSFGGGNAYDYVVTRPIYIPMTGQYMDIAFTGVAYNPAYAGSRCANFSGVSYVPVTYTGVGYYQGSNSRQASQQNYRPDYIPVYWQGPYPYAGFRTVSYAGSRPNSRPGVVPGNFAGSRAVTYTGVVYQAFAGSPQPFNGIVQYQGSRTYSAAYAKNENFAGFRQYAGVRDFGNQFSSDFDFTGSRKFAGFRTYSADYSTDSQFTGTRQFEGSRTYGISQFQTNTNFTGTRQFEGDRTFSTQYVTESQFLNDQQFQGERTYSTQYIGNEDFTGTRQFAGDRTYSDQYGVFYTGQYTGQYTGETIIDTGSDTIETYTLYVRVS